jgi:hypothetical protein
MNFVRGTAITFSAVITGTPESVKVSVFDADNTEQVESVTMTLTDSVYVATVQTTDLYAVGICYAEITATGTTYVTKKQLKFLMILNKG